MRGKNGNGTASSSLYNYSTITFTENNVKVACTGDIRTLLDWEKYKNVDTKDAQFYNLFENCTGLTSAPELPATKLASYCYNSMFDGCSSLQNAPALPATVLATNCYSSMFSGCEKLTTAPVLPASTLANLCYNQMFNNCIKLSSITILASNSEISKVTFYNSNSNWVKNAGTDESATTRTLKVKDKAAYYALVEKGLDDNWKIGKCTVLDENGNHITEDSNN